VRDDKILAHLQSAVLLHQAGRLDEAEKIYAKVLKADPRNANALNLMGTIATARARYPEAKKYFERAMQCAPHRADVPFNLGVALTALGDEDGARAAYERALARDPRYADATLNLGVLLQKSGALEEAVAAFGRHREMAPHDVRGLRNLREAHAALAVRYARDPGRRDEAITHTRAALAIETTPELLSNLGDLLRHAKRLDEAIATHEQALAVRPEDPVLLHNYGSVLYDARRLDQAQAAFTRSIAADPQFIRGYEGLAKIYEHRDDFATAITILEKALSLDPAADKIIFKLSYCYFAAGDLRAGWRTYEQRFAGAESVQKLRPTPPPYWRGDDLAGKTILIWTEQGIGDQILYASMIPDVIARAAHCVIECNARLAPIFARSFPEARVSAYHRQTEAVTDPAGIDFQTPVASLGAYLRPSLVDFPHPSSYLKADPARVAALRERYRRIAPGHLIVGLSWRSKNVEIGEIKSADLALWRDVLLVPGVTFVNLQYGDCAQELEKVRASLGVTVVEDDEIDPLRDMDAFFAQVAAMDLVISTSNTTVHVAGSLGVPTWLALLGSPADLWYWFRGRPDSPWYASLRIVRKTLDEDARDNQDLWRTRIARIAGDLEALATHGEAHRPRPLQP
jgi:tetratricopeptide (TPR) repeat protein